MSHENSKEIFSESALLVESLPKLCDSKEIEKGEACVQVQLDSANKIITEDKAEELASVSETHSRSNNTSGGSKETNERSITTENASQVDPQARASSRRGEASQNSEATAKETPDAVESPCVYITNNLHGHETNNEDNINPSSDQEFADDDKIQYVWIDPDQPDIKGEYFEGSVNGVCVELYRDNGDHLPDTNNDTFIGFTLIMEDSSNQAEDYQFTNLPDGDYFAKLYSLGDSAMKLEKAIEKQSQAPTPSPIIDIASDDVIIESENQYIPSEKNVSDDNSLAGTKELTNANSTSPNNTTNIRLSPASDANNIRLSPSTNKTNTRLTSSTDTTNIRLTPSNNTSNIGSSSSNNKPNSVSTSSNNTPNLGSTSSNNTPNLDAASSNNAIHRNTKADQQNEIQSNPQSSTNKNNINRQSASLDNNTDTVQYSENNEIEGSASNSDDSNTYYNQNNSASTEYKEQNEANSNNVIIYPTSEPTLEPLLEATAEPTLEVVVEQTVEPIYQDQNVGTDSQSSYYENEDTTNQGMSEEYNPGTTTYNDSESTVETTYEDTTYQDTTYQDTTYQDTTYEDTNTNDDSNNESLTSIKIQIDPSNPDASFPSTNNEENQVSNDDEVVTDGTNPEQSEQDIVSDSTNEPNEQVVTSDSTNQPTEDVHQFEIVEPVSESTPYPAPDETSSSASPQNGLSPSAGLGFSIGDEVGSDPPPADEGTTP